MAQAASLYDLVGDLILFRNLDAADPRLPRFSTAWPAMGLASADRPRKLEPAYAVAVAWLARQAQALRSPAPPLDEMVYIGDTALNDGTAFRNLRRETGWRSWAFIGAERGEEPHFTAADGIYTANRWSLLAAFAGWLLEQGAALDRRTLVVLDVDKTALGARGRNDAAIDRARLAALECVVSDALGDMFDRTGFRRAYAAINQPRYHAFTADNQDNVGYVCLMVSAGMMTLEQLQAAIAEGRLASTAQFMADIDASRAALPSPGLAALHDEVYARVRAGDPTPFKAFREREYLETVERMGHLPDRAPAGQQLLEEICLTLEVAQAVRWLRGRGCLALGLSDKPDEAALPTAEQARRGCLPLHRVHTHMVGRSIAGKLPRSGAGGGAARS